MTATISSWGNSQGLRFPTDIMKVLIENQKIVLEPIRQSREKYDINELVKKLPNDYKTYEEFDNKIGLEEW
jgi:antitoxin MazE